MLNQIGGTMKKVFVVTMILVFAVLSVFAMPKDEAMTQINLKTSVTTDGKLPELAAVKDSYAIAAGFKSVLNLDGDFRGFAPTPSTSIISSKDGDTIQIISGLANGGDLSGMLGVYYTVSFNGGATFSTPELITSAGPFTRNYNEIATADGQLPYVIVNYRTSGYLGDWFTTDPLGPGQGGWTSPLLVTDTANYAAYMPTVAVNPAGDKVCMLAYDAVGGIGSNYSTDYGTTWGTYDLPASLNDSLWGPDVTVARWGVADDVHAIIGMSWYDEVRYDIAGASAAFYQGYSKSTDGGATWSIPTGIYAGERRPSMGHLRGDTFNYFLDTIPGNGVADTALIKCYFEDTTGFWADETGVVDAGDANGPYGFGTWWYWWDAEYYPELNTFFYAIPMADLFTDYYVDAGGDLYTFVWQAQSMVFGYKGDLETDFSYLYMDIHDADVVDTLGSTVTWRGNAFSANLAYDDVNGCMYIIYSDYVDPAVGEPSIEAIKISLPVTDGDAILRSTLVLNAAQYTVECSRYVDANGYVDIAIAPGTLDSIYYIAVDLYDAGLVWEEIGTVTIVSGITKETVSTSTKKNEIFFAPSIINNNSSIKFSLSSNTNVNISVYDVTGRMVKTLANGSFTKGTHTINMNSNDFNQGVYFVKFNAGDKSDSKKVIVVK